MKLRFSRSSLNLIIFACIILIGWASIDKNHSPEQASITLPPLGELQVKTWSSHEDIRVVWHTRLDTPFNIRIRGDAHNLPSSKVEAISTSELAISWQADYWQWDIELGDDFELGLPHLSQQLNTFPSSLKNQPATIILQGPWSGGIARLTSARIINSLKLKPLSHANTRSANQYACPWQPVSAQFWLQDQLSSLNNSRADIDNKVWKLSHWPTLAAINEQSLQVWKHTFVQQWQLDWRNPVTQFDMLADLAYYRLPKNYLLQGYWGINALDVSQLEDYLAQCLASRQKIQVAQHGEKEKQQ
jgi:hypothetical protein